MSQSLEQARAAFAWEKVQGKSNEYVNLAKAAPALVMGNGLMQTLAFFKSKAEGSHSDASGPKGKGPHSELLEHVLEWLERREIIRSAEFVNAMNEFSEMDSEQYLQATQEALAVLKWIRQLAAAQAKT